MATRPHASGRTPQPDGSKTARRPPMDDAEPPTPRGSAAAGMTPADGRQAVEADPMDQPTVPRFHGSSPDVIPDRCCDHPENHVDDWPDGSIRHRLPGWLAQVIRSAAARVGPSSTIAAQVGISASHVRNIWAGRRAPAQETAAKLADVLGLTDDEADLLAEYSPHRYWTRGLR